MEHGHMKITIIVNKPSVANAVAPIIIPDHADHEITIVNYGLWGLFKRRMPRGLKLADFPYVATPLWNVGELRIPMMTWRDGHRTIIQDSAFDLVREADLVICTTDYFSIEAHAAAMLLAHAYGIRMDERTRPTADGRAIAVDGYSWIAAQDEGEPSDEPYPEVRWLPITGLHAGQVRSDWSMGLTTHSPQFRRLVAEGSAMRHFNNAFEINAAAIIDPLVRAVSPRYSGGLIGKAALQMIVHMGDREAMTESDAIKAMAKWQGSGRHPPHELGNPATQWQIIDNLEKAGLLAREGRMLSVSTPGRTFLASLHPDCRDVDQPARLAAWSKDWPASRPAMERYVRTFFGKQKRFKGRGGA
jgi:hypothetical protein